MSPQESFSRPSSFASLATALALGWALMVGACSSNSPANKDGAAGQNGRTGGTTGSGGQAAGSGGSVGSGGRAAGSGGSQGTGGGSSGGSLGSGGAVAPTDGGVTDAVVSDANDATGVICPADAGDAGTGDTDLDGIPDCLDGCPLDSGKLGPGVCGCGMSDMDSDGDGTPDCMDMCPMDMTKTMPGVCGCGRGPDVDTDGDGMLDCNDGCPGDATRTTAGTCGCNAPDTLPLCLRHRYSFNGTGTVATDSVGTAHGTVVNTTLSGTGTVVLAGGATDQYVNLPAGIFSSLGPSATIEAWVSWTGAGGPWQRIFDFGSSDGAPGLQGAGVTYLFLTPANTINTHLRAAFTNNGPPQERVVNAPTALPWPTMIHLALVIDGPAQTMTLYQGGVLIGTVPTMGTTLAGLNDVNNWLGRSQFSADEEFQGTLHEIRIHSSARTAAQIAADAPLPDTLPAN